MTWASGALRGCGAPLLVPVSGRSASFARWGTGPGPPGTEGTPNDRLPQPTRRMNCREFRRKHDAYIDDTLSGVDLDAMARHRSLCASCAVLVTRVRRALLVAHNLPTIELSARFGERLQLRLAQERALLAVARGSGAAHAGG